MNVSDITHYLNIVLIVLFVVVLVSIILFFLRGLARGWRYGTYRVIAFAVLITVALLTLGPITDAIGNADLASFNIPTINITVQDTSGTNQTASATFGSAYGVGQSLIEQILKIYNTGMSPEQITAYAISLTKSIVMIIILGLDGFLLATLGNLFVMILWHAAFIHTIPKDKRADAKRQGKLISAFEEMLIGIVIGAMMLFPLSSTINSFAYGWNNVSNEDEKSKLVATNATYKDVQAVVDTYDNSLFSKIFFSWTKNNEGMSYDMALTNFFTKGVSGEVSVGAINELTHLVRSGSLLVEGGVLSYSGFDQTKLPLFAVSEYAPALLRSMAQSNLLTGLLPSVLQVAQNFPAVAKYVKTDTGIDFTNAKYKCNLTLDKLASIYENLVSSNVLKNAVVDSNGNVNATPTIIQKFFSADSKAALDSTLAAFDDEEMAIFDAVLESVTYVLCCQTYKQNLENPGTSDTQLAINDFFPSVPTDYDADGNGYPDKVPATFENIKWGNELQKIYDSATTIAIKDPTFLATLTNNIGSSNGYSVDTTALKNSIIDHLPAYASGLFGVADTTSTTNGLKAEATTTTNYCLLDSSFVERALPKVLKIVETNLNTSFNLSGTSAISLDSLNSTLFADDVDAKLADRITAVKTEFGKLYAIVDDMVSTDAAKALLKDLDNLPGLYFDPDGNFLGVNPDLLGGFVKALKALDDSKIASAILPKAFEGFLKGDSSPLKSLGLGDVQLNFTSNVGQGLAGLLEAYGQNQELLAYLMSNTANVTAANADSTLKTILSFDNAATGESQMASLLKALVNNPIINPSDGKNANIKAILKVFMEKMDLSTSTLSVPEDTTTMADEMDAFVGVLQVISSGGILGKITALSSSSSPNIASLSSIDFTALFTEVNKSMIIKSILGTYLDDKVLSTVTYLAPITVNGVTYAPKFSNVTNWANEGAALDALIKAAADIGDLNSIDYFNSDPSAIESIVKALSGSQIFQAKDANGNVTSYFFPEYMADKMISYFVTSKDFGSYFMDETATDYTQTASYSTFRANFTSVGKSSTATIQDQINAWVGTNSTVGEAQKIGAILTSVQRLDGLNFISDSTDWRTVNRANMSGLLDAVATSDAFGPILTYHLYDKVATALKDAAPAFKDSNNAVVLKMDAAARKTEVGYLSDILSAALDPSYGLLDANGKLQNTTIALKNVSADYFVNPLLTGMASSSVFNTLKSGATMSAFEEEYSSILVSSSLYATQTDADAVVKGLRVMSAGVIDQAKTLAAWKTEIGQLCILLSDVKAMDLDLTSLNFDNLFSASNTPAVNEANRLELLETLKAFYACETLYKSLPDQLSKAVSKIANASDYGLTSANFDYLVDIPTIDRITRGNEELQVLSFIVKDGLSTDLSKASVSTIKTNAYTRDLIENLAKSQIFNTVKTGETETAFEKTMQKVLLDSGYYGDATDATVKANVKTVVLEVKKADGWSGDTGEVKLLEAVADALPKNPDNTELNLSTFSLTSFFGTDATIKENQRQALEDFLNAINGSHLLYPGLANKMSTSITSINAGSISLAGANCYYNGYFEYHDSTNVLVHHATLGNVYTSSEITILTTTFKDASGLEQIDLNDISKIDAAKVTTLLRDLVQSSVFNTSATSAQPVAQKIMSQALLAGGALDSTYYFASNPKDIAGNSATNYSSSATKADYLGKYYFTLGGSNFTTNLDLIDGSTGSIKSVILAVQTGTIATAVKNNNYTGLSESDLTTLLGALNDCKLYQDCVPNLLANSLIGTMGSAISGVNLSRANPYYIYYEPASGFVYGTSAIGYSYDSSNQVQYTLVSYENKYEDTELATLASLITKLNDSETTQLFASTATTSFNYSLEQIQTINDLLSLLAKSYVFNLGGPYGGNVDVTTPSALHVNDDLSVFEQALFNFLDQSGMAKLAYDQAYDYQITGTYAPEAKLYEALKTFESDFGKTSALSGTTLHSGVWQDEIDYLTVHKTSGVADGGLLQTLRSNSETFALIQNGSLSNLANMKNVSPSTIRILLKAMNQVDLVHDAVPFNVASLIEDSLNFKTYSTVQLTATPSATTFATDALGKRGHYNYLQVTLASELGSGSYPTVYAYDSTYAGASKVQVGLTTDTNGNVTGHTAGTAVYEFDMGKAYPYYFSVDGAGVTINSVVYSFNTSNYILTQKEFLKDDGSGKTALDVIGDFADSIYITKGGSKGYVDFSSSDDVSTLLTGLTPSTSPTGAHLSNILRYIGDANGFYTRNFYNSDEAYSPATSASYAFASRDIVLRRLLSFSYNSTAIDLGKYLAESSSDQAAFEGAKKVFTASGYSANVEGDFFTNNLATLAGAEGVYSSVSTSIGGITIPEAHAFAEAFATLNSGTRVYESTLEKTADAAASGSSLLGKYLAAGQLQRFVNALTSYAFPNNVVATTYLNFNNTTPPSSYYNLTNRKTLQSSGWVNPSFYSNDFALLGNTSLSDNNPALKILHHYFEVTSLLNLTSVLSNLGQTSYAISSADKTTIANDYTALDAYLTVGTSSEQRLLQTLYLSTLYDDYLNRLYFRTVAGIPPTETDFFMLPSSTSTLTSTLPSIPTA